MFEFLTSTIAFVVGKNMPSRSCLGDREWQQTLYKNVAKTSAIKDAMYSYCVYFGTRCIAMGTSCHEVHGFLVSQNCSYGESL